MKGLLSGVVLLCILIYALAYMAGGSKLANKFLGWLKKQISSFFRWLGNTTIRFLQKNPIVIGVIVLIIILLLFF